MTWTPKMIGALLLKTPAPKPAPDLRVAALNRPLRQPSPQSVTGRTKTSYGGK